MIFTRSYKRIDEESRIKRSLKSTSKTLIDLITAIARHCRLPTGFQIPSSSTQRCRQIAGSNNWLACSIRGVVSQET